MRVAAYQAPLLPTGSLEAIRLIREQVSLCETRHVDILCCPEAILGGLADYASKPQDFAVKVQGGQLQSFLAPLASRSVISIIGFTEIVDDGGLYNSAAILKYGDVVGIYRKRRPAIRSSVYRPGIESPVFEVADFRFGLMICNDTNFLEFGTEMVAQGAQVLFVPSNNALRREQADVVAATRAVDIGNASRNRVPVVRADVAGEADGRVAFGASAIIDAAGMVIRAGRHLRTGTLIGDVEIGHTAA